ncbi:MULTISPECIES: iron ABC transporter permease [unclassified Synechococcus]|uniref:ABC transporter permease n=1 Tax=unclassified Synechococcus TaxID=2626047 RepID=UPI0021A92A7C|nr:MULTISPECIES: iron ABC transporter permease [unclassified Synechococcus]MCT0214035.1 iron ABC transporter permease [Synechococcus sp. CS-1326]MCT0234053.1 iron ABC transporter permease [Synechococcus sp. CS-1327]
MVSLTAAWVSAPPRRSPLVVAVLLVCALALLPVLVLLGYALLGTGLGRLRLGAEGVEQLLNTLALLVAVGLIGAALGTANGWLTACCHFPGRRWLRLAQVIPLAAPAFVLAAVLVDLGSRWGLRVHGLGWAVLLLSLTTYTYVFLLSTESFSVSGRRQLEACRSLGVGPWGSFRRVALPLALPSIGAGVALSGMEVVNELGAVELLGVPTLSRGILQRWQGEGDLQGAVGLALLALVMVSLLVGAERWLRQRSRRWNLGNEGASPLQWQLRGWRRATAQLLTLLPPLASLAIPLTWAFVSRDQLQSDSLDDLLALSLRSFGLALAAALVTVAAALLLSIARRWIPQPILRKLTFAAGMGYAIPGTVLALALMLIGGPLGFSPLLLLLWGYGDRFLAVSKGGLDAALERIPPSVDEAATGLGCSWLQVLRRVHLPLLRGPLLVGGLLVFVDTVKELPLTFSLRPFDFDTLAVRVYQYSSDERVSAALVPALLILALGLLASLALMPSLEDPDSGVQQR